MATTPTTSVNSPGASSPPENPGKWICTALLLGVMFVYWPALKHDFVNYDDQDYVTENLVVQGGLTWEGIKWALTTNQAGNWHPLTWLTHMLDCEIHGMNAGGHHATNILFHAANSVLLFLLLRGMTGSNWRSAFVAALFALHPLRVESVAWVSERKDVLCAFFGLLTILAYVRYSKATPTTGRPKPSGYYLLALICYALGLMSKPMLVTWPFVLLLLDYWPLKRITMDNRAVTGATWKRLVIEKIPFFALATISSAITFVVQQSAGAVASSDALPASLRVGNALASSFSYLAQTFWPSKLAVFYPYVNPLPVATLVIAAIVVLGVSWLALKSVRSRPYLLTGWLWYLGMLVPVVGLVQVGLQSMADRYTYLPSIGVTIMVVWGLADLRLLGDKRPVLVAIGLLIVCGLAVLSRRQVGFWRDSESLFTHALAVTKNNSVAHYSLGSVLAVRGQLPEAMEHFREAVRINPQNQEAQSDLGLALVMSGQLDKGIEHYQKAIAIRPSLEKPHFNLARALSLQGRRTEAVPSYQMAVKLNPNNDEARTHLAISLGELGRLDEAATNFQFLVSRKPGDPDLNFNYGNVLLAQGNFAEAANHFTKALTVNPADADLHDKLGESLARQGNIENAIVHFKESLRLQPTAKAHAHLALGLMVQQQPELAAAEYHAALKLEPNNSEILNDLAWLLATHPNDKVRNGADAVALAGKAVQISQGMEARYLGTLDAAYAETGRFDEAIATARNTVDIARSARQHPVAEAAEARIKLYTEKKPYRQTPAP